MHSFRVHADGTVTWTLRHDLVPVQKPKPEGKGDEAATNTEPSKRAQKSRARAADHAALMRKAAAFRARSILRFWSRAATLGEHVQLPIPRLPQSLLPPPPPPPPPPMTQPSPPPPPERQSPPSPQQPTKGAGGARAPKRAPSTPTAGESPVAPRNKTQVVPLPPPPPSLPPSPPSPTSSSPPSSPADPPSTPHTKRSLQLDDPSTWTKPVGGHTEVFE